MSAQGSGSYHRAGSLEELTRRNVETIARLEDATRTSGPMERWAHWVTEFCGSPWFVAIHAAWFGAWIVMNLVGPKHARFDPYPFTFLTLVVSLEAIFLSTFILMSENHQAAVNERRERLDLQVNLLAEQENTKMLHLLVKIASKLDVDIDDDPAVGVLEEATRPEELVKQIERASEKSEQRKQESD